MRTYSIHSIAVSWAAGLNRYVKKEGIDLQKMILGIEILLHNIPKLVLMITAAFILGILPQTLATWVSFAYIRRSANGLHAGNSITCTAITILLFVAIPYAVQDIHLDVRIFMLSFFFISLGLYKYAPADTAACPILGKKKRERLKKQAVIAAIIIMILALMLSSDAFYGLAALGSVYAVIVILPVSYKILKRSQNNYEKYE